MASVAVWQFAFVASPDPAAGVTLGEAHARYWLPLSAIGIWFTVYVLSLQQRRQWVMYTVFILSLVFSYLSVVNEPHEGIAAVRRNVRTFQATSEVVLVQVPPGSVMWLVLQIRFLARARGDYPRVSLITFVS
jgi:hypothetical protein